MNGRKNIIWDPVTQAYTTSNCKPSNGSTLETCDRECLLFRDDYTYQYANADVCPADIMMKSYCPMRNVSLAYSTWRLTDLATNECACVCSDALCVTETDSQNCSSSGSNTDSYVSSQVFNACTTPINVCTYCSQKILQLTLAKDGSCAQYNKNQIDIQNAPCCANCGDNSDVEGMCANNTTSPVRTILILLVFLLVVVVAVFFTARYAAKASNRGSA